MTKRGRPPKLGETRAAQVKLMFTEAQKETLKKGGITAFVMMQWIMERYQWQYGEESEKNENQLKKP